MKPHADHLTPSFTVILTGVIVELVGLGLDVVLHVQDASLAAREGVFTFTNPGHLLFSIGLLLTVLGVVLHLTLRWFGPQRQRAALMTTVSFVSLLAATSAVIAGPKSSHLHNEPGPEGVITYTAQLDTAVTWAEWEQIDRALSETKAATAKYAIVAVAEADGYHQEGQSLRGAGAHFINRAILDAGVFDHTQPTFLLYERQSDWSFVLVGVGWLLPKAANDDTPPTYFSPLAEWHYHDYPDPGLCIWPDGTTNQYSEATCSAQGGRFWRQSPWMLHAWLFRPSPQGIFSLVNTAVTGFQIDDFSD